MYNYRYDYLVSYIIIRCLMHRCNWIEDYETEKDDKTRIVIKCVKDFVPSMGELRTNLSEDVLPYVEFIKSDGKIEMSFLKGH